MTNAEKKTTLDYINTFRTNDGRLTLARMLVDLHFFDENLNEKEQIMSNYAKKLLYQMGIWKPENVDELVDAFLGIVAVRPLPKKPGTIKVIIGKLLLIIKKLIRLIKGKVRNAKRIRQLRKKRRDNSNRKR